MAINISEMTAFYEKIGMPEDGVRSFCAAFEKLNSLGLAELFEALADLICQQTYGYVGDYAFKDMIADLSGIDDRQVSSMLMARAFMLMKRNYDKKGIPEWIYNDTILDIRCKAVECFNNYGVWGDTVTWWFGRFLELNRFGVGRFQFEWEKYDGPMLRFDGVKNVGNVVIHEKERLVNVHIPSTGIPLTDEVRYDSYRKAWEIVKDRYAGGIVPFVCESWLLYPDHDEFLPKHLNILRFAHDYHIVRTRDDTDGFHESERVFCKPMNTPIAELPAETSLQRAYIERLKSGKPTGEGYGVFLFDGEKIYNKPIEISDK